MKTQKKSNISGILKKTILGVVGFLCAVTGTATENHPFSRYDVIISTLPFGAMAENPNVATTEPTQEEQAAAAQEISQKLNLCAMTIMPDGRPAIGLVDMSTQPVQCLALYQGDSANGLKVILVDYDGSRATFERDGTVFSLEVGKGLVDTVTEASLLAEREKILREEENKKTEKPKFNSLAEQLIAMQMSVPIDTEAPPMPMISEGIDELTKKFDKNRPDSEDDTSEVDELSAVVKEGVQELKAAAENGESPQEYMKRLIEHRKAEVERQRSEQAAAEETLDAAKTADSKEKEYMRRRLNIELIKKGVAPLNPIELTPEEEKEIAESN